MRSNGEPRICHDGAAHLTTPSGEWNGVVLNLSVGGAFVTCVPPLPVGTEISMDLELGDGQPPVAADACVVWSRESSEADGPAGIALRFLRVAHEGVRRIARLVSARTE